MAQEETTVLIVEDNGLMRAGLRGYLEGEGMRVIEAGNTEEALARFKECHPDVAIIDIVLPSGAGEKKDLEASEGIGVAREIKALNPQVGVVLLSAYEDRGLEVWGLIRGGDKGIAYVVKGITPAELKSAMQMVMEGKVYLDPEVSLEAASKAEVILETSSPEERKWIERALNRMSSLTPREVQVLERLARSLTLEAMARELALSVKTVSNYISHVYTKLGLDDMDDQLRKNVVAAKVAMIYRLKGGGAKWNSNSRVRNEGDG